MLDNLVIAGIYLTVGFVYGVVCHFVAKSMRLRSSFVGSFIWPFTEYIDRVYDNNDFVRKNSGKGFIKIMIVFGGIKLFRDAVILVGSVALGLSIGFFVIFLSFWDKAKKRLKTREEKGIWME